MKYPQFMLFLFLLVSGMAFVISSAISITTILLGNCTP